MTRRWVVFGLCLALLVGTAVVVAHLVREPESVGVTIIELEPSPASKHAGDSRLHRRNDRTPPVANSSSPSDGEGGFAPAPEEEDDDDPFDEDRPGVDDSDDGVPELDDDDVRVDD